MHEMKKYMKKVHFLCFFSKPKDPNLKWAQELNGIYLATKLMVYRQVMMIFKSNLSDLSTSQVETADPLAKTHRMKLLTIIGRVKPSNSEIMKSLRASVEGD